MPIFDESLFQLTHFSLLNSVLTASNVTKFLHVVGHFILLLMCSSMFQYANLFCNAVAMNINCTVSVHDPCTFCRHSVGFCTVMMELTLLNCVHRLRKYWTALALVYTCFLECSTVAFCYYSPGGDTAVPGGIYARHF